MATNQIPNFRYRNLLAQQETKHERQRNVEGGVGNEIDFMKTIEFKGVIECLV